MMQKAMRMCTAAAILALVACSDSPTAPTTPPIPAASVTAAGEGSLVLHPSVDTRFIAALETPVRIRETAGGSAQ
jgi:hypothetical protein